MSFFSLQPHLHRSHILVTLFQHSLPQQLIIEHSFPSNKHKRSLIKAVPASFLKLSSTLEPAARIPFATPNHLQRFKRRIQNPPSKGMPAQQPLYSLLLPCVGRYRSSSLYQPPARNTKIYTETSNPYTDRTHDRQTTFMHSFVQPPRLPSQMSHDSLMYHLNSHNRRLCSNHLITQASSQPPVFAGR